MKRLTSVVTVCLGVLLASSLAATAHLAEDGSGRASVSAADANRAAEATIDQALGRPAVFEFPDTPLDVAIRFIEDEFKINVELDQSILEDQGADVPVNYVARGITLRSALNNMLPKIEATYWIANESLIIGTVDAAHENLLTRIYPVTDLLDGEFTCKDIQKLITEIVRPESWKEQGGPGVAHSVKPRHCLVVSQTLPIHDAIARLLADLRAVPMD